MLLPVVGKTGTQTPRKVVLMNMDVMNAGMRPVPCGEPEDQLSAMGGAVTQASLQQLATDPAFELVRWELKARIVADQAAAEIAQRMCLPQSLVEQYETKHFDIRSRLAHASVVLFEIIGVPMNDTWMATEVGRFWMWLGFAYGVPGLDLAIPPFRILDEKLQALGLFAYLHPACGICEQFRVLVAGKLVPTAATLSEPGVMLVARLRSQAKRQVRLAPMVSCSDLAALSAADSPVHRPRRFAPPRWTETG